MFNLEWRLLINICVCCRLCTHHFLTLVSIDLQIIEAHHYLWWWNRCIVLACSNAREWWLVRLKLISLVTADIVST